MPDFAGVQRPCSSGTPREARDLPWRRTRDPYAMLVAEVMLQQTQVDRVIPKWHAWLERFPTLARPGRARPRRCHPRLAGPRLQPARRPAARHRHQVVAEFGGDLPRCVDGLLRLKGVGRYTAGAVACFAYEQPVAMVDTNVRRVLEPRVRGRASRASKAWPSASCRRCGVRLEPGADGPGRDAVSRAASRCVWCARCWRFARAPGALMHV